MASLGIIIGHDLSHSRSGCDLESRHPHQEVIPTRVFGKVVACHSLDWLWSVFVEEGNKYGAMIYLWSCYRILEFRLINPDYYITAL